MRSQPTPASAKAFSALRRRRAPLRDAGFTISSTRSIRLGANLIAVAALMACQGLCEPVFRILRRCGRLHGLYDCARTSCALGLEGTLPNARGGDRTRMGSYPKGF